MSIANIKGGFFRTIEINRDSVADSKTTLIEPLLKQTQNYTCQVQRFVTNVTPQINTFTTPLFTVLRRPDPTEGGITNIDQAAANLGAGVEFRPTNIHTITELARQIGEFCNGFDGLTLQVDPDFTFTLKMSQEFGVSRYIKVDPVYAKMLGLNEYIFYFRGDVGGNSTLCHNNNLLFLGLDEIPVGGAARTLFHFRTALDFIQADGASFVHASDDTLFTCDTRQTVDVTFTMPHMATLTILDGKEQRRKLLARFPINDYFEAEHLTVNDYDTYGARETINLGLTDLCRGNPNVHTTILLPGEIPHANVRVETTYLEGKAFKTTPMDFGTHGFWSLKLLLAKKVK